METEPVITLVYDDLIKVNVIAHAMAQDPSSSLGFLSTVFISLSREFDQIIVSESGRISSRGSYRDSSFRDPLIFLRLQGLKPNYVFQHVLNELHNHDLSRLITHRIAFESQRRDLPQGPLFVTVFVKLTQKEFIFLPSTSVSSTTTDSDQESQVDESESCSICLENMELKSETKPCFQLPNCAHEFHEECFIKWYARQNSCPLCRQIV